MPAWLDPERCEPGDYANCRNLPDAGLPPAPEGYIWRRLGGQFTFSAYAHPDESIYSGDLVYIPGAYGYQAKEEFLYAVDGIGMQGGGFIHRQDVHGVMRSYYVHYISGSWQLDGIDVYVTDRWYFSRTSQPVPLQRISEIRLANGRFSVCEIPDLTPYYSVAAPLRFELDTQIFVPGLKNVHGGIFNIEDRGGAFVSDSQRFDLYVGQDMNQALDWIRLDASRTNLTVYLLVKEAAFTADPTLDPGSLPG